MLSLREVVSALSGAVLVCGAEELRFDRVTTDSRQINEGDLFVALSGERFDGHQFADGAKAKGAVALLVSQPVTSELPTIQVPDTRIALGELARLWRKTVSYPANRCGGIQRQDDHQGNDCRDPKACFWGGWLSCHQRQFE